MGNCANKPLTTEGEAPVTEEKATTTTVEEREIELDQNKDDGKKPEAEGTAKPAVEKPTESAQIEEVAKAVAVETKKEEAPKQAAEPPKPESSEPKKEEIKPTAAPTVTPATVDEKKVEEKKPVAK